MLIHTSSSLERLANDAPRTAKRPFRNSFNSFSLFLFCCFYEKDTTGSVHFFCKKGTYFSIH